MRNVPISTDVYAAIWAARAPGEETEDEILKRVLNCGEHIATISGPEKSNLSKPANGKFGFYDSRNGVEFEQGFKIFRRYKNQEYSAIAMDGSWIREDNGSKYGSLNQLNGSIVAGQENVWNGNWYFRSNGKECSIDTLRHR